MTSLKISGDLTKEQLTQLERWSSDLDTEKEKYLTREGQDEMILLAERMHKRFPNAVKHKYDNETFLVRRNRQSILINYC